MIFALLILCFLSPFVLAQEHNNDWRRCPVFCGLNGPVPHSNCTVAHLDKFNTNIRPILKSLEQKPYFRFHKTQLHPTCAFWPPVDQCFGRSCSIDTCSSDDLPDQLAKAWDAQSYRYSENACQEYHPLGHLDTLKQDLPKECSDPDCLYMRKLRFCRVSTDESDPDSVYVDLALNPERYTGYPAESAIRIWRAIYQENCRWDDLSNACAETEKRQNSQKVCYENQIFNSIISGFHTSVNVHVCGQYYFPSHVLSGHWGYNLPEFTRRFGSAQTKGQGIQYLKNLYFLYLFQLRAISKAAPYLRSLNYDDDLKSSDECLQCYNRTSKWYQCCCQEHKDSTRCLVNHLLDKFSLLDCLFDESTMFKSESHGTSDCYSKAVKEAFQVKFENITRILDCVACDKCRMWGRLQINGVGTALNVLFHGQTASAPSDALPELTRGEIVSLVNGFLKSAESLHHIAHFRKLSNEEFRSEL